MTYLISGKVIRGDGYGNKIGYPTINLDRRNFLRMKKRPAFGVYAGKVNLYGKSYRAGIIIGPKEKKNKKGLPKIEAHLIGFKGNAYGKKATLKINRFLRKFKKFKTEKELTIQIGKDLKKC